MEEAILPAEVLEFLEAGHSTLVATRDARHVPAVQRAMGVRAAASSRELTVLVPAATADQTLTNLGDNGRIAVTAAGVDHRSVQVKGRVVEILDAGDEEHERVDRYRSDLAREWGEIGVPPRYTLRLAHWPCKAIRLRVEAVFVQTPGPDAGAALGAGPEPLGPSRGIAT